MEVPCYSRAQLMKLSPAWQGMAHVIASHSAEHKSCTRLINLLLGATLTAAVMSGVNAWFGIPLVMLASYIGPIYWKALKKRYASHRFFMCKCLLFTDPRRHQTKEESTTGRHAPSIAVKDILVDLSTSGLACWLS